MGAVFFAAYVDSKYAKDHTAAHRALDMIDTVRHDIVAANPNDFVFATKCKQKSKQRTAKARSPRSSASKAVTRLKTIRARCGISTLWASAT